MALSNKILLSQISLYVCGFILSGCLTLPLLWHQYQFGGHCLLFSRGNWQEEDGLLDISWASKFYCLFPSFCGLIIFFLSGFQIVRLVKIYQSTDDQQGEESFLALFLDSFTSLIACTIALISAIFITLGFIVWCGLMNERFPTCDVADGQNITKTDVSINTDGFYTQMGVAQFGGWSCFAVFVGLSTFALLKLINNHQLRNLRVSMYLERQRLVNEDSFRTSLSEPPHSDDGSD